MSNNFLLIFIVLVIVIPAVSFLSASNKSNQADRDNTVEEKSNTDIDSKSDIDDNKSGKSESGNYKYSIGGREYEGRVTVNHRFSSGEHVIAGTIETPTACYEVLVADVIIQESYPEMVTVDLSVRKIDTFTPCIQVIAYQDFDTNISVSKNASIYLSVNGNLLDFHIN